MADLRRYHRQMLLSGFGEDGQRRLADSTALLVGCGALGTVIAESLTRAGVGRLIIVDRDVVELTNLQRQVLFDEDDARQGLPKAVAAQQRLTAINSQITIDAVVADFCAANAQRIAESAHAIIDGTDNLETRYLLNDLSVKIGRPYVYGGAVGTKGMVYTVLPHTADGQSAWETAGVAGPCLRCVFDQQPAGGAIETCDTVGVLGPAAGIIANLEAAEALKILTGNLDRVSRRLTTMDLWSGVWRQLDVAAAYQAGECLCCGKRQFEHLDGQRGSRTVRLCGRNAVQVAAGRDDRDAALDLQPIAARLTAHGRVTHNEYLLRAQLSERGAAYELTLFSDGRAIVHGTDDPVVAKGLYARYVGL